MSLRWSRAAGLAALLCLSAREVRAAPCGRPDVDFTFPPNEASAVPANALLSAHYAAPAIYADEAVSLVDGSGSEIPLTVMWDEADSLLRVQPESPLSPGFHELSWPGLRGLSGGGVGRGRTTSFFVRTEPDSAAPTFEGLSRIDWDLSRDRDPCLDRLEDRFVFELTLGEVSDDADVESLSVLVFETRAPGAATAEPTRVALRNLPPSGKLEVRRPASHGGKACFAAIVQDLVGNVSGGGEREACVETQRPPFFDGCNVVVMPRGRAASWTWWPLAALVLGAMRRGTRARHT